MQLPQELYNAAHRLSGELAWPAAEARQVVTWLEREGCEVVGMELWREKDGQPQWIASSNFSPASDQPVTAESIDRCVRLASQFIYRYQEEPGALFNLTWLEPVRTNFSNYSIVRLLTDKFRVDGARLFDVGYIIEVYSDGKYEVEFSEADGTTKAQIVVSQHDIQTAVKE